MMEPIVMHNCIVIYSNRIIVMIIVYDLLSLDTKEFLIIFIYINPFLFKCEI